jgi:hypothetical protein
VSADRSDRYITLLWVTVLLAVAIFGAFAFYEWRILAIPRIGIDTVPRVSVYDLARSGIAVMLSVLIIGQLYFDRSRPARIEGGDLNAAQQLLACCLLIMACGFTILFVVDPAAFNILSLEDNLVEWASAILPLLSSILLAYAFIIVLRAPDRDLRRRLALVATAGSALILFLLAGEEVSWLQRVFHIDTPAMFASNQQHEMNFHNMHTVAIGTAHKMAGFACLILLPFIYDTAPANRLLDLFSDFIPSRFVVAASAPLAGFNYNSWNFFPTQMEVVMTVLIVLCYARAAYNRGSRPEMMLFIAMAVLVVVAQGIFLIRGSNFIRLWDVTEYKELFIAIGLALFAWEATVRLRERYLKPRQMAAGRNG